MRDPATNKEAHELVIETLKAEIKRLTAEEKYDEAMQALDLLWEVRDDLERLEKEDEE